MVEQQKNSKDQAGGNSREKKKSGRRRRRRSGARRTDSKKPGDSKPKVRDSNFKPQRLVPLGVEPLPLKKVHAEKFTGLRKKNYGVLVYETIQAALDDRASIVKSSEQFDQLNVVIKAEGPRSHPDIDPHAKLFCGEAWHLIHERRIADGWYNEPQY